MGRKSRTKLLRRKSRYYTSVDSEVETIISSTDGLKPPYIKENYIRKLPLLDVRAMEDEDIPDFQQLLSPPKEVLGLNKFYTDEFDAFQKYYSKINQCMDDNSVMHLVNAADRLPYESSCELSEKVKRIPKKDEQNVEIPQMKMANNEIEFAHPFIKLVESRIKGRHMQASDNIQKGEILIDEKATVLQVNPICLCMEGEHKMYRCHHCAYAVHKFYTCAGCNIVIYCSVSCLVQSYNDYHRFECEGFQRHYWKLDDTDYSYIAFRMMLYGARYNFNHDIPDNHNKWGIDGNNYPFLYRLETHFDKIPVRRVYEILRKAAKTVTYLIVRTNFFSEFQLENENILHVYVGGLFVKHYCQAQMNCILLRYPNFDAEYSFNAVGGNGKAICPTIAMISHSCSPNAVVITCNDRILVKAIKPIEPLEEITISYQEINTFFSLEERRLLMTDYFYFPAFCRCSFCMYEATWQQFPYKCRNCTTGFAQKVSLNNGDQKLFCKDCHSYSYIDTKSEKTAEIAGKLYRATYNIDPIVRVAESYDKIFPWDSWMLLDTYRILYDKFAGWGEKPIETMKYGLMYFKVLERYLSRLYPPLLEAKLKFFYGVVNTSEFMTMEKVTEEESHTIRYFFEECIHAKKDILFYIPVQYLEFYYLGLLSKMNTVKINLKMADDS